MLLAVRPPFGEGGGSRRIEERVPGGSQLRIAGGRRRRSIVQRWTPNPLSTKSLVSSSSLLESVTSAASASSAASPSPGSIHTPQSHGSCFQVNISHERRAIILEYKKSLDCVKRKSKEESLSPLCVPEKHSHPSFETSKNITYFFPLKRKKHLPLFFPFLCSLQPVIS